MKVAVERPKVDSMKTRYIGSTLFFLAAFGGGICASIYGRGQYKFLSSGELSTNSRVPAAIRRDLDFSKLDGAELITASQKRLVTAARVILQDDELGIELGHFVTRGTTGKSQLACDFYDRVTLRFEAEGIAESGDKPVMEIDGPCRPAQDISQIAPIWVPVARILNERPNDMDLKYGDQGVEYRFVHIGSEWPMRWALQSVRLYNGAETGREVNITKRELYDLRAKPLVLNWSATQSN